MGDILCKPAMRTCISASSFNDEDIESGSAEPTWDGYRILTPTPLVFHSTDI